MKKIVRPLTCSSSGLLGPTGTKAGSTLWPTGLRGDLVGGERDEPLRYHGGQLLD